MKNLVFITAIKSPLNEVRSQAYQYSILSWKTWCALNGCELRVLDEPLFPTEQMKPNFFRYYCFDLLKDEAFDQICLVDADTVIHHNCPNFFELTDEKFCAVHNDGDYDWVIRSVENYQFELPEHFTMNFNIWKYFNSGFLVFHRKYERILREFVEFFEKYHEMGKLQDIQKKYGVGTDQPLINLWIQRSFKDELKLLSYQFNMQELQRKNMLDERMIFTRVPGIYHFNGIDGGPEQANYWISNTYKYLYEN